MVSAGRHLFLTLLSITVLASMPSAAASDAVKKTISPIASMQQFISRADGERCPMYPTCSHYASEAFAHQGMLMGWVLSCDRLLRCGRDETHLAEPIRIKGHKYAYDPLEANTFWWNRR